MYSIFLLNVFINLLITFLNINASFLLCTGGSYNSTSREYQSWWYSLTFILHSACFPATFWEFMNNRIFINLLPLVWQPLPFTLYVSLFHCVWEDNSLVYWQLPYLYFFLNFLCFFLFIIWEGILILCCPHFICVSSRSPVIVRETFLECFGQGIKQATQW